MHSCPAHPQMAMRKVASDIVGECMQTALMRLHGEPQASVPLTPVAAVASSALSLTARVRRARSQLASFTEGAPAAASPLPLKSFNTPAAATRPTPVVFIDEVPRTPVAVATTASMATSPMPATPCAEGTSVTTATAMTMTSPKTPMAMPTNVDVADGSRLAAHLESVTISNELLRDGNRSLQREVDRLRSELEAAATASDKELREAQDALAGLGTELAELQKVAAVERAELAATAARLEQTQAEATEWEVEAAAMASVKVQQGELKAELEAATAALAVAETRAEQLAAQLASASSSGHVERAALASRAEAAEAALANAKADIARLTAEQAEKEVGPVLSRRDVMGGRFCVTSFLHSFLFPAQVASGKLVQQLEAQVGHLQEDLRAVYNKHKKELRALEEEYRHTDYEARYASLTKENQALRSRAACLQNASVRAAALAESQATVAARALEMQESLQCREAALRQSEAALAARAQELSQSQAETATATAAAERERADFEAAFDELQVAYDALSAEKDAINVEFAAASVRLSSLEGKAAEVEQYEAIVASLRQELEEQSASQVAQFVHDTTVASLEKIQSDELARLSTELDQLREEQSLETRAAAEARQDQDHVLMEAEARIAMAEAETEAAKEVSSMACLWGSDLLFIFSFFCDFQRVTSILHLCTLSKSLRWRPNVPSCSRC